MPSICLLIQIHLNWWQAALVILLILILISAIQKNILHRQGITQEMFDAWQNDPENWKGGVFYYNPKDPRIMPPKRIAWLGWTINFAKPLSIFVMIAIIILIITLINYLI